MKNYFFVLILSITGCATPATFTQPMNNPFIVADQTSQITYGIIGPNKVTSNIYTGLNYYRNGVAILQNPWNILTYY